MMMLLLSVMMAMLRLMFSVSEVLSCQQMPFLAVVPPTR